MEDYKKKYEEALGRARTFSQRWQGVEATDSELALQELKEIFPELKESEDEVIRKELIECLKHNAHGYCEQTRNRWLAWLEKQGEQNPTDKVEPKFKVGDWIITDKNHIWLVDEDCSTTGYSYRLISQNGKIEVGDYNIVDKHASLWTIEDAKNGDVLVNGSNIFIFSHISTTRVIGYCHIKRDVGRFYDDTGINVSFGAIDTVFTPATKEQHGFLFKKMKEAGYEWDFENKKLKKIEPKPVWSEENDKKRKSLIKGLEDRMGFGWACDPFSREEYIEWLKSLKERVKPQTKQEWTGYDEKAYEIALLDIDKSPSITKNDTIDWLKSLKEKYAWKPSDEQMEALLKLEEMHVLEHEKNQENAHLYMVIKSLKEQLLKLKGE